MSSFCSSINSISKLSNLSYWGILTLGKLLMIKYNGHWCTLTKVTCKISKPHILPPPPPGDQILAVNEHRLTGLSRNKAIAILRKVEGDVTLLLARPHLSVAQVNTSSSDKVMSGFVAWLVKAFCVYCLYVVCYGLCVSADIFLVVAFHRALNLFLSYLKTPQKAT